MLERYIGRQGVNRLMRGLTKIVLGTVQFGLDYGVTNIKGKVDFSEVIQILDLAHESGISILDSASSYGDSEAVLGKAFKELKKDFSVISKIYLTSEKDIHSQVFRSIEKSLKDLGEAQLYAVMAHNGEQMLTMGEDLSSALMKAKKDFNLPRVGASVYDFTELRKIHSLMTLDIIQIPYNVLNQKFIINTDLDLIKKNGCEVHARSIFLQGLLLSEKEKVPSYFKSFEPLFNDYYKSLEASGLSALEFNLANAWRESSIDKLVLGVTSRKELLEIIKTAKNIKSISIPVTKHLAHNDENLINPAKWKV